MWDVRKAPILQRHKDGWWRVSLFISDVKFPFQYPPHQNENFLPSQILSNILSLDPLHYFHLTSQKRYKYVLYDEVDGSLKWEEGENRTFGGSSTDHILVIVHCTDFFR